MKLFCSFIGKDDEGNWTCSKCQEENRYCAHSLSGFLGQMELPYRCVVSESVSEVELVQTK